MTKIKDIPKLERPREKALFYGLENLSNAELLALIISTGTKNSSALDIAYNLLSSFQGLKGIIDANIKELCSIEGINESKALRLLAGFLFYERGHSEISSKKNEISGKFEIARYFNRVIKDSVQEKAFIAIVDRRNKVIGIKELFKGTKDKLMVSPKLVIKEVSKRGDRFYLIHNHPSNNCAPSDEDRICTSEIEILGYNYGIELVDHLIIAKERFFSLADNEDYEY